MTEEPCEHLSWECCTTHHYCGDCGETLTIANKPEMYCDICGYSFPLRFTTKDSGKRQDYVSGMRRDIQDGKPRFDLLLTDGQPYENQFLTRFAGLLERGATKYGERNWQLADSGEEQSRFRASAIRHLMQWACGEDDEDHAAAVCFNLMAYEYVKWKLDNDQD